MTKIKVKKSVGTMDIEYSSVESVIEELTGYIERYGAGKVSFEKHCYQYEDGDYMAVMVEREETDDEYKKRLASEKVYADRQAEQDKAEFERLKKKFG